MATIPSMPEPAPGEPGSVLAEKASPMPASAVQAAVQLTVSSGTQVFVAAQFSAPVGAPQAATLAAPAGNAPMTQGIVFVPSSAFPLAPEVASFLTEMIDLSSMRTLAFAASSQTLPTVAELMSGTSGDWLLPSAFSHYDVDAPLGDVTYAAFDSLWDWFFG
jgi:hypothetical protein